jgi:GcrA cell cycle regulator
MASVSSTPPGDARGPPQTSRNIAWPRELIERLKTLWNDNRLSAAQMGHRLGLSRSAVIGKAHRLGLSPHKAKGPPRIRAPRPAAPKAKQQPPAPPIVEDPAPPPPEWRGLALLELARESCRYPQGDRVPYSFCGAAKLDGASYCAFHYRLCYTPASSRPVYIPPPWADHRGRR